MNAEVQDEAEPLKSDDVSDDRRRSKTMSRKEMARDLRRRRLPVRRDRALYRLARPVS